MRLFILGATGGTGLELLRQGLDRRHSVTAFVRAPEKLEQREGLTVVGGDVTDATALETAMRGHDAVLTTLGPRQGGPTTLCSDAMRATVKAMQAAGLKRLQVVSVAVLFRQGPIFAVGRFFLRHVAADAQRMEDLARASGQEWTVVRPPRLTDGPKRGQCRSAVDRMPPFGYSIARADVADFMLTALENGRHVRDLLGVCK